MQKNLLQSLEHTALIVIDIQENHYPHCVEKESTLDVMQRVVKAAKILEVPTIVTEHYPKIFGPTVQPLAEATRGITPIGKMHFSCLADHDIHQKIREIDARKLVLIGTETQICITQTALMGLEMGFKTAVIADAVTGRKAYDHSVALDRMRHHGVDVLTWESLVYEWMRKGGTDSFKKILPLVKQ